MRTRRLEVSVTFDERRGYVASAPELRQPVTALSLGGIRRRIEARMLPDDVHIVLHLDRAVGWSGIGGGEVVRAGRATLPGRAPLFG